MLSFAVYADGKLATRVNLSGAYVVGTDDVPLRADIEFANGIVQCKKRSAGPAGLAVLWNIPSVGEILLETVRVPEREAPYNLQVELLRGRLMRLHCKVEDWGLFDYDDATELIAQADAARDLLIKALQADTPAEAGAIADGALALAVQASESLTQMHAELFLNRRIQTAGFSQRVIGCGVHLDQPTELGRKRLSAAFDFATIPFVWRDIEPSEQAFQWKELDDWVDALAKDHLPMRGSALLSFSEGNVPDWLYIWEHDFDTIRDLAFEHIRRVINRYGQYIQSWNVVSGIHANTCFSFTFEQLMELTRMATALTKQLCPNGTAILELVAPWGEYYARNQRTIPPLLYADMAIQSGVNFDAFGLQFYFGSGVDGMYVRDMFQVSALLDQFLKLGKPLHITAVQVPSEGSGGETSDEGGVWRSPWTEQVQADWLRQFVDIALSKPFVESVSWQSLVDNKQQAVPHGGLLRADLVPKVAYNILMDVRSEVQGKGKRNGRSVST